MAIYITGSLVSGQLNYSTGDAESVKADLNVSISNVVYTTGDQTISGNKTFENDLTVGTGVVSTLYISGTRVGINTESPAGALDVNGSAYFNTRPQVNGSVVLLSGDINLNNYYPSSNPSGFITGVDTSNFYTNDNPSGFITGVDLSNYYTNDNPSGFVTNADLSQVVYTTGDQTITGNKTFTNRVDLSGIKFDAIVNGDAPPQEEGVLYYSDDDKTLNLYNDSIPVSLGEEQVVRGVNTTSNTITKGQAVYLVAAGGGDQFPGFNLSIANSEATSKSMIGLAAHDIAPNNKGWAISFGKLVGVDTNSYNVGDTLYLSPQTSGGLTGVKPYAPEHMVTVGTVVRQGNSSNGVVFVSPKNGFELDELHNVAAQSPASGNLLRYDGNLWQSTGLSINDLSDVDTQTVSPISGYYLRWNGSNWASQSGDGGGAVPSSDNIDLLFKQAYNTYYHELSYNPSGALTGVGVWNVPAKTTQLYTKQLNYSGEYLTGVVVTDVISTNTLTKTLSYDVSGNLISTTRIYT
jgi:hypothetical protein